MNEDTGKNADEPDIPLLVRRPLDRAVEALEDAISCIRQGDIAQARDLTAEARSELDTAERRVERDRRREVGQR